MTLTCGDNIYLYFHHLQSGGECVRAFISVSYDQLANWKDGSGNSGLKYAVQVISKLLDPANPEYAASFIGRLVAILISKAGSALGEDVEKMLRMVLSKMQQTETMSVMQVNKRTYSGTMENPKLSENLSEDDHFVFLLFLRQEPERLVNSTANRF